MFQRSALTVFEDDEKSTVSLMRLRLALLLVSCLCLAASFPLLWGNAALRKIRLS